MKKFVILLLTSVLFATSAFGLGFAAGVNGNIGGNLDAKAIADDAFSGGAGAYVNAELLFGAGLQAELAYNFNQCNIAANGTTVTDYKVMDVAIMPWYSLNLLIASIGLGAGVNFAFYDQDISNFNQESFIPGVCFTVNGKIYIGSHFGIVAGVHGIFDLKPLVDITTLPPQTFINGNLTDYFRKAIYGTLGVEVRL